MIHPILYFFNQNDSNEIFLPILDYVVNNIKPWYYISNKGNVYSYNTNKMKKLTMSIDGYMVCTVRTKNNKGVTIYIHRVEMMTFKYIDGCENLSVDHIDCNKSNNSINNLEWVTLAENTKRASLNNLFIHGEDAPWSKLSESNVHDICKLYLNGVGITNLSRMFNCGVTTVFDIVKGKSWKHITSQYNILPYNKEITIKTLND